jgi:hypothetical protein
MFKGNTNCEAGVTGVFIKLTWPQPSQFFALFASLSVGCLVNSLLTNVHDDNMK